MIVATTDRVVMRPTFAEALAAVVDPVATGADGVTPAPESPQESDGSVPAPATPAAGSNIGGVDVDLAEQALATFERAQTAQQQGDWTTYGEEMANLQAILEQLANGTGPVGEATPAP